MTNSLTYNTKIQKSTFNGGRSTVYIVAVPVDIQAVLPPDLWAFKKVEVKIGDDIIDIGSRRLSRTSQIKYVSIPIKTAKEYEIERGDELEVILTWE